MAQFGTCGHCGHEWYSVNDGKQCLPKIIPTCPEGGIMAVCKDCFDSLPSAVIIDVTVRTYNAGIPDPSEDGLHMSPTEHLLVASAIRGWVRYMKRESDETPFTETAFRH